MGMFCYQCEQTLRTANTTGCNALGICGKTEATANLQDLLIYALTGLGVWRNLAKELGSDTTSADYFIIESLFTTLTNVNFDAKKIEQLIYKTVQIRDELKQQYLAACDVQKMQAKNPLVAATSFTPLSTRDGLLTQATEICFDIRNLTLGDDITGLYGLVLFGLKGVAAYTFHAHMLKFDETEIYNNISQCLEFLASESSDVDAYLNWALKLGETNYKSMALLDNAHTSTFGHPEPTQAKITPVKGKALLVSGHDLHDLELVLEQTMNKGINVYTHGEMLPGLAYPKFKKYPHLIGNYGGAWQDQHLEFANFPGSILMTSNCLIEPLASYKNRIFTTNAVGWSDIPHLENGDFTKAIESALTCEGFTQDEEAKFITTGFARNTVLSVADKVIDAVKTGAIKHFFLIGGCDGAKSGRNYYTEFADAVPNDCVILTLGCGKYRFNKNDFGDINGIPRLLDMGQCNDAYSAVQVALALADAFNCGVNQLPLSLIVSWFEQKAVAVLLTLLYLGVENIHLGPSLPGFLTPNVINVLVDKFKLRANGTAMDDLKQICNA